MKTPCARAREALMRTGGKPKYSTSTGAGGVPQFFFHPKSYSFCEYYLCAKFQIVAQPLLGEKFVVGG